MPTTARGETPQCPAPARKMDAQLWPLAVRHQPVQHQGRPSSIPAALESPATKRSAAHSATWVVSPMPAVQTHGQQQADAVEPGACAPTSPTAVASNPLMYPRQLMAAQPATGQQGQVGLRPHDGQQRREVKRASPRSAPGRRLRRTARASGRRHRRWKGRGGMALGIRWFRPPC